MRDHYCDYYTRHAMTENDFRELGTWTIIKRKVISVRACYCS